MCLRLAPHSRAQDTTTADDSMPKPGLERLENGSSVLHRGWAVAPVVGRLVLFSGGSENWHAPLPVGAGRRQSLQIFFGCTFECAG